MKKQPTQFDYSTLVSYMLPKGILDSFEINRIEEEDLGIKDETGTEIRVLHIFLDERDIWHTSTGRKLGLYTPKPLSINAQRLCFQVQRTSYCRGG